MSQPAPAAGSRARWLASFGCCSSFGATLFLFEAALHAGGPGPNELGYYALVAAASAGLASLVAAASVATAGGPHLAVIGYAALTTLLAGGGLTSAGLARAAGAALLLTLFWRFDAEAARSPLRFAVLSAAALAVSLRIWPRLNEVLSWHLAAARATRSGWLQIAAETLALGGCLVAAAAYSAARRRRPRLPGAAPMALAALALAVLVELAALREPPPRLPQRAQAGGELRPSVLLLVLDTVSAARLSIYGHTLPTTPELAALLDRSDRAVLYPRAFSTSPWTAPAHASLFTGLLPSRHRVDHHRRPGSLPPPPRPLLAEVARREGYATAAVFANRMLQRVPGIFAGFDLVIPPGSPLSFRVTPGESLRALWMPAIGARAVKPSPPAEVVNERLLRVVRECDGGPCFVFANYMDAHSPYAPVPADAGRWADPWAPVESATARKRELARAAARYDEALRSLDRALGKLLEELDASGVLDRWWLIVTSDHGEAFGEHGRQGHGKGLHVEQTWIPLVVHPPLGVRLEPTTEAVSLLDVATTIAAIVGGEGGFGAGRDLRRPATEPQAARMEFAGSVEHRTAAGRSSAPPARAVVLEDRALIESAGRLELYTLGRDPRQREDLASDRRGEVERLRPLLPPGFTDDVGRDAAARAARGTSGAREGAVESLDAETRRALQALGYLE